MDLVTGRFNYAVTEVVIGQPGQGGLAYGRVFVGQGRGWRDTMVGTINATDNVYTVSIGSEAEVFFRSGSTFTPQSDSGSTLTLDGTIYTFTTSRGAVAILNAGYANVLTAYTANVAAMTSYTAPNGEQLTYHFNDVIYCRLPGPDGGCLETAPAARLQSVTNNRGYQIHYRYRTDDPNPAIGLWLNVERVMGLNNAVDACLPTAPSCTTTRTWPRVVYAQSDNLTPFTEDELQRTTGYGYSGSGDLNAIRFPGSTADDVAITYDGSGRVTTLTDATGAWTYDYSTANTVVSSQAATSQTVTVVANPGVQRAATVTVAPGETWTYGYDGQRRLTRVTPPQGNANGGYTELTYGARGNVSQVAQVPRAGWSLSTVTTTATYPANCDPPNTPLTCNSPTSTTDANQNVTTYEWSPTHGGLLRVTRPAVNGVSPEVRYGYQSLQAIYPGAPAAPIWLPTTESQCASGVAPACLNTADEIRTTTTYNPNRALLPTSVTSGAVVSGGAVATVTTDYDPNGDVIEINGPLAGDADRTTYAYDVGRRVTSVIGPDPDGSCTPGCLLLNRAQTFGYRTRGDIDLVTWGTTTGYDPATFSPLQRQRTEYTPDRYGRVVRSVAQGVDANNTPYAVAHFGYDGAGRMECVATRMNPSAFFQGGVTACQPTLLGGFGPDRITRTAYDAASRVRAVTRGDGQPEAVTEEVTYTANGLPLFLIDGNDSVSELRYDGLDRLSRLFYPTPGNGQVNPFDYDEWTYDPAGNATGYRNRAGETFASIYDALNRLTTYTPPTLPQRSFAYDNLDRPLSLSTSQFVLTWGWDQLSRQTREYGPLGTLTTGYDPAGRRTSLTWPDGFVATYGRYVTGEMLSVVAQASGGPQLTAAVYGLDNLGRRSALQQGGGVLTTYGYDPVGRLNSLTHAGTANGRDVAFGYTHNPAGQIVTRTASNPAYDAARAFSYEAIVNDRLNRISTINGLGFAYADGRGNLTTAFAGTAFQRTYGFDPENNLTSAAGPTGTASYQDDPLRRLFSATGPVVNSWHQHDGDQLVTETDAQSYAVRTRHVPADSVNDIVVSYAGPTAFGPAWPLRDERGSVLAQVDALNAATQPTVYDDYGLVQAGPLGTFGYTGQQVLLSDLQDMHNRSYQPILGRFLQPDPLGYAAGMNLYGYVGADPVNRVDPLGLQDSTTVSEVRVRLCDNSANRDLRVCGGQGRDTLETLRLLGRQTSNGDWRSRANPSQPGPDQHSFPVRSRVCDRTLTSAEARDLMSRVPAPNIYTRGWPQRSGQSFVTTPAGHFAGRIYIDFSPDALSVVNTTMFPHPFVGEIQRGIDISGPGTFINTLGIGNAGDSPLGRFRDAANDQFGPWIMRDLDAFAGLLASVLYEGC